MDEDKGFTVIDKRGTSKERKDSAAEGDSSIGDVTGNPFPDETAFPELNFSTFILSLSTSALVQLGELPDPISNTKEVNLDHAKQTINIIEILQDKTRGNLSDDEERIMELVLYDLRMKFIAAAGLK